jgi:3-phosphoshikimate 1-carboxyvinyltransferase
VEIAGRPRGASRVSVDGTRSSQGVSAILVLGPALPGGLVVDVGGPLVSAPYVDLTIQVIRAAGGTVSVSGDARSPTYEVAGEYGRLSAVVEGDWSGAAYPLAAAAATGGDVVVRGLQVGSAQADRRIVDVLRAFGAEVELGQETIRASGRIALPVDVDLADAPDLGPLVGALACLVPGRSRVRGAAHLRIKESDRIAATVAAARELGFQAEEHEDGFSVLGGERSAAGRALVDSRGDHRIAMSFGVAGLVLEGVEITQPECVAKTYAEYWSDLSSLLAD